jgi:metallo-beta-lactamase family protein
MKINQDGKRNKLSNKQNKIQIIVTASGMCDEGMVVKYLEKYLIDEKAVIVLTGFQAKDTNGFLLRKLFDNEYNAEQKRSVQLKLQNKDLRLEDIKCKIEDMSEYYSGHADQEQLLDYITPDETRLKLGEKLGRTIVLLNHGTDDARETLKQRIEEQNKDTKVILPEFNKWINVSTSEYEPEDIEFISETNEFIFAKADDIHIYYPAGYDEEKIQSIVDYINNL